MNEQQSQAAQTSAPADQITRLLTQVAADAGELQGLVIGYVRKDGGAAVRWTPMNTAMLSHLHRIFGLKVDREYMASMTAGPGTRAPNVNQAVTSALRTAKASPAQRLAEREKTRNKVKSGKKSGAS